MKKIIMLFGLILIPLMGEAQDLKHVPRVNNSRTTVRLNKAIDQVNTNTPLITTNSSAITNNTTSISAIKTDSSFVTLEAETFNADSAVIPIFGESIYINGMMRQTTTWHLFGGFSDSAVVIDLTEDQFSHITNATSNLWNGIEANGIEASGDTTTFIYDGDYFGSFSATFTGGTGVVYVFEAWNVTTGERQGFPVAATGDGDSDYVTVTKPLYFDGMKAGDKLILRVTNQDSNVDITVRFGSYFITYLHE